MLGLIVRSGHHGKVMSIGEGILVRCVEVGRIVVVSIDGLRKFIQSGSRNVILHILSRVLPVRDILGTVGVPVLMEPVGEVADDGQPVERLDGEFGRVGEVGLPVHIDVLALREYDMAAVADSIRSVKDAVCRKVEPGTIRVLRSEDRDGVCCGICDTVLDVAYTDIGIGRSVE